MADTSRSYAEKLIGGWDRSQYAKLGDLADTANKTKWSALQNQFANLKAQLESQREAAKQDYSEGLGAVSENSYDRMNQNSADLVKRGLTASGAGNLIQQMDTRAKGKEVNGLLDTLGNVMAQNASNLKQGGSQLHQGALNINQELSDTLAKLSSRDMESQMDFNKGAADIAEARDTRVANNELAAMQRRASGGGGGSSKENKDEAALQDFYKRLAINATLADENMTPKQKAAFMKVGLGVGDPSGLLSNYMKKEKSKDYTTNKGLWDSYKNFMQGGGLLKVKSTGNIGQDTANQFDALIKAVDGGIKGATKGTADAADWLNEFLNNL